MQILSLDCLSNIYLSVSGEDWRRKWQPTPVFLPGESPWTEEPGRLQPMRHKESDTTKWLRQRKTVL